MNSLIGIIFLLISFNTIIFLIAKQYKRIWKISSGIFILSSPVVFFSTLHVIGEKVGDEFAGGFACLTFTGLLILNAIFLFIISIFVSSIRKS
ncbi:MULTISPECIES: hypothetical protein [Bacillus]|uniref:hypothetical protein n=1 Tax=Bacillus TaxID=1386 RepID=UPI000B43F9E9|nr:MULTISPECIES: hypothetical protein [Bacillus]MBH0346111.1 hypothetical protein [Bacillus thuringiensis]MDA1904474.1 hypothetical protein [Bacillus cereus]MDA2164608.1 hypothetical protein [Bacillus cereus]MDQ7237198.1 hypothetical protein [Bacillus pacificus]MDQ7237510.1 hypothetical protein [Bacillus pacificus]